MKSMVQAAVVLACIMLGTGSLMAQGNWVQQPTALLSNPTTHIQIGGLWGVAMVDTGTGFAAGYASVASGFSGVLRKTAGDPTWYVLPSANFTGLATSHSLWSAVTAVGTNVWVCGSNGRLYRSTDNGANWASATTGMTGTNTLFDMYFKNVNEGMAVGNNGSIYYTSDGGSTWIPQTLPGSLTPTIALYAVHSAGNYWYVTGEAHRMIKGQPQISSSSWVDISANLPAQLGIIEGLQFLDDNLGFVAGVINTGNPVARTVNGGTSFTSIGGSLPTGTYNAVYFHDQNNGWVGDALPALHYTTNGGTAWNSSTITALPSQSITNWLTRIDFVNPQVGFASGGAPGTTSTGWILKFVPAQPPDISTTPTSLDFGTFSCGTWVEKQFVIPNTGTGPLNISAINFSHPEFAIMGPIPGPIAPTGGATIVIRWTPSQPGSVPANAGMTILSNDPAFPAWQVDFSGMFNSGSMSIGNAYTFPLTCVGDSVDVIANVTLSGNIQPKIISFEHLSGAPGVRLVSPAVGSTLSGSTLFTFRYTPLTPGNFTGTYRILYGDPLCPKIAAIVFDGSVNSSEVVASPTTVDFGEVCVGQSKDMVITLTNNGNVNAVVSSRTFISGKDAFPNQHFSPVGPIQPGGTRSYNVRFSPSTNDLGLVEGVYKLRVDPCGDSVTILLRGFGVRPEITFTPTNLLALGPVPVGQTSQEQVTITNSGLSDVTISGIALTPTHPRVGLTGVPTLPRVLNPGGSVTVNVRFTPDRIETILSELVVRYSTPCADSARLPVIATSSNAPAIVVAPVFMLETHVCPGELLDTLWVRNAGVGLLTLKRFIIGGRDAGHFAVRGPALPSSLGTGDSVGVIIAYNPPGVGNSEATLTIEHDDPAAGNASVVQLWGTSMQYGWQVEGDSTTVFATCAHVGVSRTFNVRNLGVRPLQIRNLRVLSGAAEFHVAGTPLPAEVAPGTARSFEITFSPVTKGNFSAVVEITTGPCNEIRLMHLTGQGSITELQVDPTGLAFASVNVGASGVRSLQLRNLGSVPLTVAELQLRPDPAQLATVFIPQPPSTPPFVVAAGATQPLPIEFHPQAVRQYSGQLCLIISAPCPDTVCVDLQGEGISTGLALSKSRIDFALDPCTLTEVCDTVDIVNSGSSPVTINTANFDQPGFTAQISLPLTVPAGSRRSVVVCVDPNFTGTRSAVLTLGTSDPGTPTLVLAVEATRPASSWDVSASELDFGTIAHCENAPSRTLGISNTGAMMEIIELVGSIAPFAVVESLPAAIQPGEQRSFTVRFLPTQEGVYMDTLVLRDSRCQRVHLVILRGAMYERSLTATPDPLLFSGVPVGSTLLDNISVSNAHLSSLTIDTVIIDPPDAFLSRGVFPVTLSLGQGAQLPIEYSPPAEGPHTAIARIIVNMPCRDTIRVELRGTTLANGLNPDPSALDYGVLPQCVDSTRAVQLRNDAGTPVLLQASRIEGADAALFSMLNPVTPGERLEARSMRPFDIRALSTQPPTDRVAQATLVIETDSPAQPRVTVPLTFDRRTLRAPDEVTVDFGTVFTGATSTRTLALQNPGSMDLTFDTWDGPAELDITPPFPITIRTSGAFDIDVRFTPATAGARRDTLYMRSTAPCDLVTRIIVLADVRDGVGLGSFTFVDVPLCVNARRTVQLRNNLDDAVTLSALLIEAGPDAAYFNVVSPSNLPLNIPARDSIPVIVEFQPDPSAPASYAAVLRAILDSPTEQLVLRSNVTASTVPGTLSGLTDIAFGPVEISGSGATRTLTLRNSRNFDLRVSAVSVGGAAFALTSVTPAVPVTVAAGDSLVLTIGFVPGPEGAYVGQLTVSYDNPCVDSDVAALSGQGVDTRIPITVSMPLVEGAPDEFVDIPILLDRNPGNQVTAWSGTVRFNASMLYPLEIRVDGTLSEGLTPTFDYDPASGEVIVSATGAALRPGSGRLAYLRCLVLIGSDSSSALEVGTDFTLGPTVRIASRVNGNFVLSNYCVADGKRLIRDRAGLRAWLSPNPVETQAMLHYRTYSDAPVELRIVDMAGREVVPSRLWELPAGEHVQALPAQELAPGMYSVVLRQGRESVVLRLLRVR